MKRTFIFLFLFSFSTFGEPKKSNKVEDAIKHPHKIFTNGVPNNYASPGRDKHDKGPPPGQIGKPKDKPK